MQSAVQYTTYLLHWGSGCSKSWPGELESTLELLHLLLVRTGSLEVLVPQALHEGHYVMSWTKLQVGFIHLSKAAQHFLAVCHL